MRGRERCATNEMHQLTLGTEMDDFFSLPVCNRPSGPLFLHVLNATRVLCGGCRTLLFSSRHVPVGPNGGSCCSTSLSMSPATCIAEYAPLLERVTTFATLTTTCLEDSIRETLSHGLYIKLQVRKSRRSQVHMWKPVRRALVLEKCVASASPERRVIVRL